jgi:hypothetical protein
MALARFDVDVLAAERADQLGQQARGKRRRAVLADQRRDAALHPLLEVAAQQAHGVALRFDIEVAEYRQRGARRRRARHHA